MRTVLTPPIPADVDPEVAVIWEAEFADRWAEMHRRWETGEPPAPRKAARKPPARKPAAKKKPTT